MFSYQLLANDVVVDTDSSGKWVRLLSNSGGFTYKCLANNTVGTTISENEKNITVAGNYYTAFCSLCHVQVSISGQQSVDLDLEIYPKYN